ncbi:MAG: peptidoglycan-associated lipoprotein [Bradymonadia bacterium]|jgi:peptidoglycan-associated lipoprotein
MTNRSFSFLLNGLAIVALAMIFSGCRSYPTCNNNGHCERYERGTPYCVDRICRECSDDSACGEGERCSNYECVAIPGWCSGADDCAAPMVCRNNRCEPQCSSDGDCGPTERCDAGECIEAECRTDDQCEAGFRCDNYTCQLIPPPPEPCASGEFETVLFDFDESVMSSSAQRTMDHNLACFNRESRDTVLAGHCDERGTTEYNLALGERRSRSVRSWLESNDIPRSRLRTVSYGETRPAARGNGESVWRQNRRVEISWD